MAAIDRISQTTPVTVASRIVFWLVVVLGGIGSVPSAAQGTENARNERAAGADSAAQAEAPFHVSAAQLLRINPDAAKLVISPLTVAELETLADEVFAVAKQRTQEAVDIGFDNRAESGSALTPEQRAALTTASDARVRRAVDRRRAAFDKLTIVLDEWERKGGDADAIAEYRKYRLAVQGATAEALSIAGIARLALDWLRSPDGGLAIAKSLAIFIGAVFVLLLLARIAAGLVRAGVARRHSSSQLHVRLVSLVTFWAVMILGVALVLVLLGIEVTPFVALLGGASFVLAFALQETLGNLFAGIMIMLHRPFDLQQRIVTNGVEGTVISLSLASTRLRTPDNQLVTIPNASVWNDVIVNASDFDQRRVDLEFILVRASDAVTAMEELPALLAQRPEVLASPAPQVQVGSFDGRGALLHVRPWVNSPDYWAARHDLNEKIMLYLAERKFAQWSPR